MFKKSDIIEKGYIDEAIAPGTDILSEIRRMRKEKNAVILAHYYQTADIQELADFVDDSLELSRKAASASADIIIFAGVKFMAETAKILSPETKVLLPDLNANCSLADTCPPEDFKKFVSDNPGRTVISYINSSVEIKALSDIICTSSNAYKIIESLPVEERIIFAPDRNLGAYIADKVDRDIIMWQGACHVHENISVEAILDLKEKNPDAGIIVHPECETPVRKRPDKIFLSVEGRDESCRCNECNYMKLITMKKIYLTLKYEEPEILIEKDLIGKAAKPIRKMLDISDRLGL